MEPLAAPKAKILLVSDRVTSLVALEAILAPLGQEVVTAPSGEGALRLLREGEFALVLLELQMAGTTGLDTAALIRQRPTGQHTPIVLFGAAGPTPMQMARGYSLNAVDFLVSPFDPDLVRAKASVFVGLHLEADMALRNAIMVRDEFLSVASHELRTPLTSLKLEVANLLRLARRGDVNADGRLTSRVEKIDAQATRLHRLIDELLDVSRIAEGSLQLELEEVDLSEVANEVGLRFGDEAVRLGSPLRMRAGVAAIGYWDRSRLDQLITNLLSNAIKYGEGKPIDVSVEVKGERAVLVVRDGGLGIAPVDQSRIFGRFERAASSRNYGGIGLGLWLVKQIVDALGGTVTVDSRPGLGATFTVELPRARASAAAGRMPLPGVQPDPFRDAIPRAVGS